MPIVFLLLFIAVPIAEIAIFIKAGERIGLTSTIALVVLTAILGTAMLRRQGLRALARVRASLDRGEMPVEEVLTGLCLLVAGALLLTPGFLTDAVGFALFVPAVRRFIGAHALNVAMRHGEVRVDGHRVDTGAPRDPGGPHGPGGPPPGGVIIDGDYAEIDETDADRPDGPGDGPGGGRR